VALCIRGVRTNCLQGDDVSSGVGRDWYGWACSRLCDLGSRPFSVDVSVQEWKVAFLFFHCDVCIVVKPIGVVQKLC
jgi:hypothetical protein